jgi:hypothetical protein
MRSDACLLFVLCGPSRLSFDSLDVAELRSMADGAGGKHAVVPRPASGVSLSEARAAHNGAFV